MSDLGFDQLGLMISSLDATHDACHIRISELRRQMDIACGQGHITLREWRTLLDRSGKVLDGKIGNPWKVSYHTGRSMMECEARLRRLMGK